MDKATKQKGLAKLIILIVVAIIILSYLGINIQKIAESDTGRANFGYLWQLIIKIGEWLRGIYEQSVAGLVGQLNVPFKIPFLSN